MPSAAKRPCLGRGRRYRRCSNLVYKGLCPICQEYDDRKIREYDKKRYEGDPDRRFWMGPIGRRISKMKLGVDPLCERCLKKDIDEPAVLVHHMDRDQRNNVKENLESLCNACHEEEHKADRWGVKYGR